MKWSESLSNLLAELIAATAIANSVGATASGGTTAGNPKVDALRKVLGALDQFFRDLFSINEKLDLIAAWRLLCETARNYENDPVMAVKINQWAADLKFQMKLTASNLPNSFLSTTLDGRSLVSQFSEVTGDHDYFGDRCIHPIPLIDLSRIRNNQQNQNQNQNQSQSQSQSQQSQPLLRPAHRKIFIIASIFVAALIITVIAILEVARGKAIAERDQLKIENVEKHNQWIKADNIARANADSLQMVRLENDSLKMLLSQVDPKAIETAKKKVEANKNAPSVSGTAPAKVNVEKPVEKEPADKTKASNGNGGGGEPPQEPN